ncbi:hypothetical protein GCM10027586_06710 [Kineococcus gypseus]|uniref:hypothetical protein n=1 Tax=Kineococcus gypseus TaxID=1637102 RepID=UPI003D7D77F4
MLLVTYPLIDVLALMLDRWDATGSARSRIAVRANVAISALAAVVLATVGSDTQHVLLVWGIWAIAAGAAQLLVALVRGRARGRWPMLLSGGLSVLAGAMFAVTATGSGDATLSVLAGYAVLGAVFFLTSALRLHRSARSLRLAGTAGAA